MKGVVVWIHDGWIGELELSSLFLFLKFFSTLLVLLLLLTGELAILCFMGEGVVAMVLTPTVCPPVFLEGSLATGGLLPLPGCNLELTLAFSFFFVTICGGCHFLAWRLLALQQEGFCLFQLGGKGIDHFLRLRLLTPHVCLFQLMVLAQRHAHEGFGRDHGGDSLYADFFSLMYSTNLRSFTVR